MPRSKSTPIAALIVAIVNLVLFIPCLCCSGANAGVGAFAGDGSAFVPDPKMKEDIKKQQQEINNAVPNFKTVELVTNILKVIASIMMVSAAIGLLMKQSWGRLLCILGAAFIILVTLGHAVYQATTTIPAISKVQEEQMKKNPAAGPGLGQGFFQGANYIGLAIQVLLSAGYPLIALFLMMTPPVRDFYSTSARDRRQHEDDLEREDDRREDDYDDRREDYDR